MKILFLSYYFEPDLGAGAFRNTALANELSKTYKEIEIDVCSTAPIRYDTYKKTYNIIEKKENLTINRFETVKSSSSFFNQALSFFTFAWKVKKFVKGKKYDLVFASSSRLMTAFLGANIAKSKKCILYLDIRDIFRDVLKEMNKGIFFLTFPFFYFIEIYTIKKARKINLVSEGFEPYFKKNFPNSNLSFFTNGIDDIFLGLNNKILNKKNKKINILYAGNIGLGQSLENFLPKLANKLKHSHDFNVIGDGGKKKELKSKIEKDNICNIILKNPMTRENLIEEYLKADILFLHLNNLKAFEKVLPSKIFEYAALNKPILAGVSGFAKDFMARNISGCVFFSPGKIDEAYSAINDIKLNEEINRIKFVENFSRKKIMVNLAKDIYSISDE